LARFTWLESPLSWLARHKKRVAEVGIGFIVLETVNQLYDFFFFPFALAYWGPVKGALIVTGGAFLMNAFVYFLYDYMKVDWMLAYAARELSEKENKNSYEKFFTWIHAKKRTWREKILVPFIFVGLNYVVDPVIVAVHYRRSHFKGISFRDWGMLFLSTGSACALWLLTWEPGILLLKFLCRLVHH